MGKALPTMEERIVQGEARVLQIFDISVKGKTVLIGGCKVNKGAILSSSRVVVKRADKIVYEGLWLSFSPLEQKNNHYNADLVGLSRRNQAAEGREGGSWKGGGGAGVWHYVARFPYSDQGRCHSGSHHASNKERVCR